MSGNSGFMTIVVIFLIVMGAIRANRHHEEVMDKLDQCGMQESLNPSTKNVDQDEQQ